jgi:hypothetical protein
MARAVPLVTPDEEVRRQKRLADQSSSMYSILRDRYAGRALVLELALLSAAFLLLVLSLAPDNLLIRVRLDPNSARDWAALLSALVFLLGLVTARLDYRGRASLYGDAARRLYVLKAVLDGILAASTITASDALRARAEYGRAMESITPIGEREFLGLKAAHLRKVRLSKLVDLYPSVPLWMLRLRLLRADLSGDARGPTDASR